MSEKKRIKVYCGFPSNGTVVDMQPYVLREIADRYQDVVELVYPPHVAHRIFHDCARNAIVEDFLATDCDILWFLDSDVVPPRHVMDLVALHADKWEAAGAPYPVFMAQPGQDTRQIVFTVYKGAAGNGLGAANIPMEGHDWVDGIATGCIFIKRSVLEKMKAPYFEFHYNPETRELIKGEDFDFCFKLKELGIKFFIDYSATCKHMKNVCLLEMNNYAMSYAKKAVEAYDARIKEQVTEAVLNALRKGKEIGRREAMEAAGAPRTTKSGLILP